MVRALAIPLALLLMAAVGCAYPSSDEFGDAASSGGGHPDSPEGGDPDVGDASPGDATEVQEPSDDLNEVVQDPAGGDVGDEGEELLLSREGDADVDGLVFEGVEDLSFTTDQGLGDDVCRISYKLKATEPRHDCDICEWAFDLMASEAQILAGTSGACADLGYDNVGIANLLAQPRSYGFARDYYGHADVLVVFDPAVGWDVVSFANWSSDAGEFSYVWSLGYVTY